ncbi:dynamin family protein [Photobacterium ganghwense]|uniref:dynamin family protein n=1 Tax=Photobacterium ganghwense TaxID=320778 RepID=UPI001A8D0D3C|nr:dynamin family protein [Photobacterium ganghwense]QSV17608.1 dynamin family protein [Photobacterium ganghwense]
MNINLNNLQSKVADLCMLFSKQANGFTETENLLELKQELADKISRFSREEQCLSIGIMGQVKAGKSTFLNALLFNGEPVLPEAATPKTANLTRITYGEEPRLEVEYYSLEEWQALEKAAAQPGDSAQAKVARELIALAQQNQLNVAEKLQHGNIETLSAASNEELLTLLNQYVGENGRYTALVKMTHLYLPREELRGYEVVDTPGMNDPIQSRTQKTRDYMAECDVVFFLSRASQFLDQSDMNLLSEQLPGKGVKRMVLVAGQLDGAILDDGYNRTSLAETEENILTRLGRGAEKKIQDLVNQREQRGQTEIAAMLSAMKRPVFASTFAHGFACLPQEKWNRTMQHSHNELTEMAEDEWNNYQFTQQDWLRIGNFATLQKAYEQARADRQPLLDAQRNSIASHTQEEWQYRLQLLKEAVESRHHKLKTGDINSLQQQKTQCEQRIGKFDMLLKQHIRQNIQRINQATAELMQSLEEQAADYKQVHTQTGTKTIRTSRTISTSSWYKPWTWGDRETVWDTEYEIYQFASSADAAEQVRKYAQRCKQDIEHKFNQLINPSTLKHELKASLINVLDTKSEHFDPQSFRTILDHSIEKLRLPALELETGNMADMISSRFQGEVKGSDVDSLRSTLADTLRQVFQRLGQSVRQGEKQLCDALDTVSATLTSSLTQDLRKELDRLEQDFNQREKQLDHYQQVLQLIKEHKHV